MIESDMQVVLAMLLYFVVVVVIGFVYAKRSNSSSEEYFLGGRGLGPWLTALSAEASDMSGWLLMGLPGVAYFTGASDAMWTAIGLAIGTYLNWKFVAKRLRKYSEKAGNAITVPDFFSNRFHDTKHILMTIAAVIILLFFTIYTASCFVTVGKLFATLFGWDYGVMMVIGAIIVFLYTFMGGYLSVCTTDLVQGTLMFLALATVFVGSVTAAGGVENTVTFLQNIPGFLSGTEIATPLLDEAGNQLIEGNEPMFGPAGTYGIITIVSGLAWGLGYFGMPQVLIRFMSIRHSDEIKKSRIIAMIWLVVSLSSAVCIGLIGRAVIPTEFLTQSAAESVFIVLSKMLLPSFFCGLVVSGIFAAAMSSSSSYLLISGSAVATNIFKGLIKRDATDNQVMIVARITLTGHPASGHLPGHGPELLHLRHRVLRLGRLRRVLRPAHAVLAVLAPHHAAWRHRRHADRCRHRGGVEEPHCPARRLVRCLRAASRLFAGATRDRGGLQAHEGAEQGSHRRLRHLHGA